MQDVYSDPPPDLGVIMVYIFHNHNQFLYPLSTQKTNHFCVMSPYTVLVLRQYFSISIHSSAILKPKNTQNIKSSPEYEYNSLLN